MNRDVFLSILALDSYNRGYEPGLDLGTSSDASGTQIGNATISKNKGDADARDASFYAIAYNWEGETIISYRGSDYHDGWWEQFPFVNIPTSTDFWDGWSATAGWTSGQVGLAIDFYEDVTGTTISGSASSNVTTNGHSLGGVFAD